jgi:IS4 transposase
MDFAPSTIARIYKERWKIEVFFKTLKQNLKIKTFVGTSENALRIQIWTAMLTIVLLRWLHHLSKARWSLSNLVSLLRLSLFTYRDLEEWLNDPFETPPQFPMPKQLPLDLFGLGQPILSKP